MDRPKLRQQSVNGRDVMEKQKPISACDSDFNEEDYLSGKIAVGFVSSRLLKQDIHSRRKSSESGCVTGNAPQWKTRSKSIDDRHYLRADSTKGNAAASDAKGNAMLRPRIHVKEVSEDHGNRTHAKAKDTVEMSQNRSSGDANKAGCVQYRCSEDTSSAKSRRTTQNKESTEETQTQITKERLSRTVPKTSDKSKDKFNIKETKLDKPVIKAEAPNVAESEAELSGKCQKDDTDKVYNYLFYIGTRIPSKTFSQLCRSVNEQERLQRRSRDLLQSSVIDNEDH